MSVSGSHDRLREWHAHGAIGVLEDFDWGTFWFSISRVPFGRANPPVIQLVEQSEQGYVFDGLASDLMSILPFLEQRFPELSLVVERI